VKAIKLRYTQLDYCHTPPPPPPLPIYLPTFTQAFHLPRETPTVGRGGGRMCPHTRPHSLPPLPPHSIYLCLHLPILYLFPPSSHYPDTLPHHLGFLIIPLDSPYAFSCCPLLSVQVLESGSGSFSHRQTCLSVLDLCSLAVQPVFRRRGGNLPTTYH